MDVLFSCKKFRQSLKQHLMKITVFVENKY